MFGDFATGYVHDREDLRASTQATYLTMLHNHLIPVFGLLPVAAIDRAAVHAWWVSYGTRTAAARTDAYVLLKKIMTAAVAAGLLPHNPCTPHPRQSRPLEPTALGRTRQRQCVSATTLPNDLTCSDSSAS